MSDAIDDHNLKFRVGLLERASAENARRLAEIGRAIAQMRGTNDSRRALPPREFAIDADSVSPFDTGFYYRQMDDAGRPYRWTGRGDFFELRFALDRNVAWKFWMELQANQHVALAQLRGFVDYAEIPLDLERLGGPVGGIVPARPLSNVIVMTFHLPVHFVPRELDPSSTDSRTLGVVFYGIKFAPLAAPDGEAPLESDAAQ